MKTAQDFAETLNGPDPTDVLNVAELAVPQDLEVQFEESAFQSVDPATTDPAFESKEMVRIPLDHVFIDGSIFPRATLDLYTVQQYAAALIRGENLPPITVEENKDHEYRILDGVHRFEAYRLRRDVYAKNFVGDFYDEPLPSISDTELNTIPCFVDNVPPGMDAMIFCLLKNRKHGKPPTSEDYRKVARELYKKNVGAPIRAWQNRSRSAARFSQNM